MRHENAAREIHRRMWQSAMSARFPAPRQQMQSSATWHFRAPESGKESCSKSLKSQVSEDILHGMMEVKQLLAARDGLNSHQDDLNNIEKIALPGG